MLRAPVNMMLAEMAMKLVGGGRGARLARRRRAVGVRRRREGSRRVTTTGGGGGSWSAYIVENAKGEGDRRRVDVTYRAFPWTRSAAMGDPTMALSRANLGRHAPKLLVSRRLAHSHGERASPLQATTTGLARRRQHATTTIATTMNCLYPRIRAQRSSSRSRSRSTRSRAAGQPVVEWLRSRTLKPT